MRDQAGRIDTDPDEPEGEPLDTESLAVSAKIPRDRRVRVLVADEFPVVRRGVIAAVRRRWDLEMTGQAEDGDEALRLIRASEPDVALVERRLPVLNGAELAAAVRDEGLATRVLIFSSDADGAAVRDGIAAGAAGFITKREPIEGMLAAIRTVASGETYLSDEARDALWAHLRSEPPVRRALTSRELQILRLSAQGATNATIGRSLHLSLSTVKNHQRLIYEKLGVSNAAGAVYIAVREGLLDS
ncbi:MAG: response regulator [Solirubrobacteraceae bacterium]